jgi:hypothetical protein
MTRKIAPAVFFLTDNLRLTREDWSALERTGEIRLDTAARARIENAINQYRENAAIDAASVAPNVVKKQLQTIRTASRHLELALNHLNAGTGAGASFLLLPRTGYEKRTAPEWGRKDLEDLALKVSTLAYKTNAALKALPRREKSAPLVVDLIIGALKEFGASSPRSAGAGRERRKKSAGYTDEALGFVRWTCEKAGVHVQSTQALAQTIKRAKKTLGH